ncbi:MAG: aldo/keto reductase [Umezawaea sp.]
MPATKANGSMGEDPSRGGSSRRWIIAEVEHSSRRLETDHTALYQVHHPGPRTDVEATPPALTDEPQLGRRPAWTARVCPPRGTHRCARCPDT